MSCINGVSVIATIPEKWTSKWPELIPGVRFCDPAELKGAYVYLASEASSYMTGKHNDNGIFEKEQTLTQRIGANLVIDGGYTLP
jgi:sorbose reductase